MISSLLLDTTSAKSIRIVDLCTGSGCIALLIANALRTALGPEGNWKVVACDRSPLAVELARENALKLGFTKSSLHIVEADIFDNDHMYNLAKLAGGPFDIIVSNPPYIPRREWNNLGPEVKTHEDPAALIGERNIAPASTQTIAKMQERKDTTDERQAWLDRSGLAFHARLAELLYRPSFSASTSSLAPPLPRLVAEYGKGQHKAVEKLHADLKPPKERLPKIVRITDRKLVIVVWAMQQRIP